ncbi:LacI family transcriptional regulator [Nocardioides mangrovicus]|uniref:LacI family transcriptional regulator n=1 Tax=Nocardioides mangrovicus TaxID=2478913 RepID=A0A3L8P3R6_9ACTN|nr:substrate-binding domain-containing protein [Nocardioides mangrovicus]RLV50030.1 LacI family transcriptional regulator [Nocardioides mangrovicus]
MRGPTAHGSVRLADVARHVGTSSQTISNALNHPERLTADLLERSLAGVEELGYRPNRSARTLRNQRSRLIGVRVEPPRPDRAALLLDQFLHALAASAAGLGYHLILAQAAGDTAELDAYEELRQTTTVDAFVLSGAHRDDPRAAWLRERGISFASFGRPWDTDLDPDDGSDAGSESPWVDVDGAAGVRAAVRHVAAQGHEEIAFLGWPEESDVGRDRRRGWAEACHELGLPARRQAGVVDEFEAGRDAAHRLLHPRRGGPVPTAVVCASDTLALGVLRTLSELGLRAGADVAVTGFDNTPTAALTTPGLTSLEQPLAAIAAELLRLVDSQLRGDVPGSSGDAHTLLAPTLVVRGSSTR